MNEELAEEIQYEVSILVKSGFYSPMDINEIIEEQFIGENFNFSEIDNIIDKELNSRFEELKDCKFIFFNSLKKSFIELAKNNIVSIHNAGFDFEDGVNDAMEIYTHLVNNKFDVRGFVFYSFYDIEECITDDVLYLSFGDYNQDKDLALNIGEELFETLKTNNLEVHWNHDVDERISIKPFKWMKKYEEDEIYEMEGAVETYIKLNSEG